MKRWLWIVAGSVPVAAVLVVTAIAVGDTHARAEAAPVPASCPANAPSPSEPAYSGIFASHQRLVPFVARHVLLCDYNGLNAANGASARALYRQAELSGGSAARLGAALNAADEPVPQGAASCPSDDGAHIQAYFWSASQHIEVSVGTNGCKTAENGARTAWIAQSDIAATLAAQR